MIALIVVGGLAVNVPRSEAFYTILGASAGYDSNADVSREEKDTFFTLYRLQAGHEFDPADTVDIGIYASGSYQQRFSEKDTWDTSVTGTIGWKVGDGRIYPGFFAGADLVRDDLNNDDAYDAIRGGCKIEYLYSGRLTLGLKQSFFRYAYREPVRIQTGIPRMPMPVVENEKDRVDRIGTTTLEGEIFISPSLKTRVSLDYNDRSSTIAPESYQSLGLSVYCPVSIGNDWEIDADLSAERLHFDKTGDGPGRKDTLWGLGLTVNRYFKKSRWFVAMQWTRNDSGFDSESYEQTVIECGVGWYLP